MHRIDPASGEITLDVLPSPLGSLAEDESGLVPKDDLDLYTSTRHTGVLHHEAGVPIALQEVSFDLAGGNIAD
nr:DUF4436 family protein [Streptomyces sp. SID8354]